MGVYPVHAVVDYEAGRTGTPHKATAIQA